MTTKKVFIELALSFQGIEQKLHFERIGFKSNGKTHVRYLSIQRPYCQYIFNP